MLKFKRKFRRLKVKFHITQSQPTDDHEWEILWFPRQFAVMNTAIDNYGLIHWNRNIGILLKWAVKVLIRAIHLFLVKEINPSRQLICGKTMMYERFVTDEKIEQATSASCDDTALPGCRGWIMKCVNYTGHVCFNFLTYSELSTWLSLMKREISDRTSLLL